MKAKFAKTLLGVSLVAVSLSSCVVRRPIVVGPRPGHVVAHEGFYSAMPVGARVTYVRGVKCWVHEGRYYRWHAHHHGYVVFVP
ncbi:MAG: hypothetical protein WCL08_01510 [Verrucomicrobiota bacterium]